MCLQLAGLKALVQFSAIQRMKCSQSVIQKHFTDMLAGKTVCERVYMKENKGFISEWYFLNITKLYWNFLGLCLPSIVTHA